MTEKTADGRDIITVEIHIAWWYQPYVDMLVFFCNLMGAEPDWDKLERLLQRAVRIKEVNQ